MKNKKQRNSKNVQHTAMFTNAQGAFKSTFILFYANIHQLFLKFSVSSQDAQKLNKVEFTRKRFFVCCFAERRCFSC